MSNDEIVEIGVELTPNQVLEIDMNSGFIKGDPGADGVSPTVSISRIGKEVTITITDATGEHTALLKDGIDGIDGDKGADGESPTTSITKVGKITTITITDPDGTQHVAQISDGIDGQGTGNMNTNVYDKNNNGKVDIAELAEKADEAGKLHTPRQFVFTGAMTGTSTQFDGTENVSTALLRKSVAVYSHEADRANQWVRVARLQAPPVDEPVSITFSVQANVRYDGVASKAQSFGGIIICKFNPNQTPKLYLIAGNYHPGLFALSYTATDCDLWMLLRDNWESHTFAVINESSRINAVNEWVMDTTRTSISDMQMSGLQNVRGQYIDDQPIRIDVNPSDWVLDGQGVWIANMRVDYMPVNALGTVTLYNSGTKAQREEFRKCKVLTYNQNPADYVVFAADGNKPSIMLPFEVRAKGVTP